MIKYFKELELLVWIIVHLFIIVFCIAKESKKSYPPNPPNELQQLIKLAIFEEDLVAELFKLKEHFSIIQKKGSEEETCQLNVFKYISEYEEDELALEHKKGEERASIISEHPFLTLKMIRRLVHTLLKNTMENCRSNERVLEALQNTFKKHGGSGNVKRPTEQSLEEALQRILMIHFIYGYTDANGLANGVLNGRETKVVLNFYDCLALAKKAMEQGWLQLAYQWMSEATSVMQRDTTEEDLGEIYDSWDELAEKADVSDKPEMHKKMMNKRQEKLDGTGLTRDKYGLCRGERRQKKGGQGELVSYYDRDSNPYFLVNPIKVERLSKEPLILKYHDFVTDLEIKQLKNSGFDGKKEVKFLKKVNKRIEGVTRLRVKGVKKSLQRTLETSLGSFCEVEKGSKEYISCKDTKQKEKALATFYINTNEVQMGGYLTFPKLDIFIKSEKGSAIFWYNKRGSEEGNGKLKDDHRTALVSCPVILGKKHVIKWNLASKSSSKAILQSAIREEIGAF